MRLRGVGKRYGRHGRAVLTGVDLELAPREITAISGGNGSGKSTLLRILVGVTRPSEGTVHDRPRDIGYVPERFPSDERLTARSYLAHMGRLRGLSTRDATRRGSDLLAQLALAGGVDTALRRLSKGNLQKVALAKALLVPPRLLVLDEPWSGLDASAHGVLTGIIADVSNGGGIVVFTDHRESVVGRHATSVHRIADGRLSQVEHEPVLITRLVLRTPDAAGPEDVVLAGTRSVERDGDRIIVWADASDADRVLFDALRRGWSVVAVDEPVRSTR